MVLPVEQDGLVHARLVGAGAQVHLGCFCHEGAVAVPERVRDEHAHPVHAGIDAFHGLFAEQGAVARFRGAGFAQVDDGAYLEAVYQDIEVCGGGAVQGARAQELARFDASTVCCADAAQVTGVRQPFEGITVGVEARKACGGGTVPDRG